MDSNPYAFNRDVSYPTCAGFPRNMTCKDLLEAHIQVVVPGKASGRGDFTADVEDIFSKYRLPHISSETVVGLWQTNPMGFWQNQVNFAVWCSTMGEVVLELLDPDEQYKLFTVVGKAAKEPLAPITEEEGVSEHRIKGKTVVRGDQVSAGSLHGIDQQMWEKGREYLVFTRYELRPLPEQNGEPGPMLAPEEDGEFVNCFVRYVVSHFQNKMTWAGSGLTPKRRRILEQFDKKLADTGCKKEDMLALETALKVKLVAVDALGNTLWDSGLYKTSTKVVVPCHNNHAWADIPTDPPKVERVHLLDEPAEQALSAVVTSYGHKAKTTAAQKTLDQKTREILVAFAARAIPSTTRLWLCGQSLVGSDGSLWRSRSAAHAIDKAFEAETCASLQDDLPKELEEEYHKATHSMGGATAYRFGKWLSKEDIRPTPEKFRPAWKAAQVEAKVWNSEDATAGTGEHHHLDMRAAYLACEDSLMGGVGDAIDLVREYGFPTSIMRRGNCEGVPLSDVLRLTGTIQLSAWEFAPNTRVYKQSLEQAPASMLRSSSWQTLRMQYRPLWTSRQPSSATRVCSRMRAQKWITPSALASTWLRATCGSISALFLAITTTSWSPQSGSLSESPPTLTALQCQPLLRLEKQGWWYLKPTTSLTPLVSRPLRLLPPLFRLSRHKKRRITRTKKWPLSPPELR